MTRLSVDSEAWSRGFRTMPLPDAVHAEIIADLQERLLTHVHDGKEVVLDLSFWSREMRDEWRALLAPVGVLPEIVHVVAPRSTALERVQARAADGSDDFRLPPELAAAYFDHFESPTADEAPITVVRTG